MVSHLLLIFVISISSSTCVVQEYFVSPTPLPNPRCPQVNFCHTLNQYAANSSHFFNKIDNISLLFLDGVHNLIHRLEVIGTANFYMSRLSSVDNHVPVVAIDSQSDGGLSFNGVLNLTLEDLTFISARRIIPNKNFVQCFNLLDIPVFVVQKLLFIKCGINASYKLSTKHNPVSNPTKGVSKVISSTGTSTSNNIVIMIRLSHFDRANVTIQSTLPKDTEISSYGSVLTTLANSSFEVGGIFAELEGTELSLDILNTSLANGTNAVDILVSKSQNRSTLRIHLESVTLYNSVNGVILRSSSENGHLSAKVNITNCHFLFNKKTALFFESGIEMITLTMVGSNLCNNQQAFAIEANGTGIETSATIIIRHCEIKGNALDGLSVGDLNVVIEIIGSVIERNANGIAVQSYSALYTNVTITGSNVSNNQVNGIMIQVQNADIKLTDSRIEQNSQTGVTLSTDQKISVEFVNSIVKFNTGGGINIALRNKGMVYLLNTTIERNYKSLESSGQTGPSSVSSAGLDVFCWNGLSSLIIVIN